MRVSAHGVWSHQVREETPQLPVATWTPGSAHGPLRQRGMRAGCRRPSATARHGRSSIAERFEVAAPSVNLGLFDSDQLVEAEAHAVVVQQSLCAAAASLRSGNKTSR